MKKLLWWICNRSRINFAYQKQNDMGLIHCQVFQLVSTGKARNHCMRMIRRCRRNSDRLKLLRDGKNPWDTAKMDGWEKRDVGFRLMELGMEP